VDDPASIEASAERCAHVARLMWRSLAKAGVPPAIIELVINLHQQRAGLQSLSECLFECGMIDAEKFMRLQAELIEDALEALQDRLTAETVTVVFRRQAGGA
jgi:hypothetical protein